MNHPRHEPLTPEERALAERLARIGPHADGPPPALDAKILAAAHAAAAASPRRRRWLALTSVPASLITGVGMAAALALVVGVVWQMRPASGPARAPRSEAGDMGYVSAEMIQRDEPPAPPAPPPPPPPAATAPAVAARTTPARTRALSPPAEARRQATAPEPRQEVASAPAAPAASNDFAPDEAVVDAPAPAAPAGYSRQRAAPRADAATPAADTAAAMASPAEPAFAPPPAPSAPAPAVVQRKAAASAAAGREARSAEQDSRAQAEAAAAKAAAEEETGRSLDRIEVTGSRIRMDEVPVRDDARLEPADWLDRIRQRRDEGDLDGARASLMLFRREYPHHRLPDDLRALPAGPGR